MVIVYTVYMCLFTDNGYLRLPFSDLHSIMNTVQLGFFLFLIGFLLFYLTRFYLQNKNTDVEGILKILWFILFSAFSPFLFFYAIPTYLL